MNVEEAGEQRLALSRVVVVRQILVLAVVINLDVRWGPAAVGQAADERSRIAVITDQDLWRKHYVFGPLVFAPDDSGRTPRSSAAPDSVYQLFQGPPPSAWTAPEFDDGAWLLRPGREFVHLLGDVKQAAALDADATSAYLRGTDPFCLPVAQVYQRARFTVPDRAKIRGLYLRIAYRGGFIAYVNGRPIARGALPETDVLPTTSAEVYPAEAFFTRESLAAGKPRLLQPGDAGSKQWALRERIAGPVEVPRSALRDGTNVLAIELHRAVYPPQCAAQQPLPNMVGLGLFELTAEADQGALAEINSRPRRRAFTVDTPRTLVDPARAGENERLTPLRIVAARNGVFSGQLVVAADPAQPDGAWDGFRAVAADLLQDGGPGVIPAKAVQVRYAVPNPFWRNALDDLGMPAIWKARRNAGLLGGTRFDVLLDRAPANAKELAVWASVRVPADATPGKYAGKLTLTMPGRSPSAVPIDLTVSAWALPEVKNYATLVNIYQSPETLAAYYKVKPWSEEHWRLIEQSMRLLGEFGNIGLFLPLLAESQMGNPESMVVWVRRPDGTYRYDLSVMDRYLDTALKHHDRLRFVSLNVWGYEASNRTWRGARDYESFYGARVTVQDGDHGPRTSFKLPRYGTRACEGLWRPLLLAVRNRLRDKGLADKMLLGLCADMGPDIDTAAMFRNILPDAAWIAESHLLNRGYVYDVDTKATMPVRYNSIVYGGDIPDPAAKLHYGWQSQGQTLVMNFNRSGANVVLHGYQPPWSYRIWMESALACGRNGVGRVGGDYWHIGANILGEGERGWGVVGGSGGTLYGRYMHSHSDESGLGRNCTDLFGAGPDGPVGTVRLENAREGIQETECRVFLEKALLDQHKPLPRDLAERCRALLRERTNVLRLYKMNGAEVAQQGWQERSRRLFDLAAEIEALRPSR
jgi:hypothetical protein